MAEDDSKAQPSFWWSSSYIEKNIQSFWSTINSFYFQNVAEEDLGVFRDMEEQSILSNKGMYKNMRFSPWIKFKVYSINFVCAFSVKIISVRFNCEIRGHPFLRSLQIHYL